LRDLSVRPLGYPDDYAPQAGYASGWPIGYDPKAGTANLTHCYGYVGVGRDLSPDTGTGGELYAVIGHAPRALDRNIAVVGRVIEGIERMSALPRGTEALGFYKESSQNVPLASVRLASEIPAGERPGFQYMDTMSPTFAAYLRVKANRKDDFFIRPAGGVDLCGANVPVRRAPAG
jgi:peptidylprolyl isomerase